MEKRIYTIAANTPLAPSVYRLELTSDGAPGLCAGGFVEVAIPGKYLRRPLSVSLSEPGWLTLLYKVVGGGTAALAAMEPCTELELLTGLGNGFDIEACREKALLIGGGIGVAPLLQLCRDLRATGKQVTAILGFNTASEVFLQKELEAHGATVYVSTIDGSSGIRGLVTDALKQVAPTFDYFYVCGPMVMMRALYPLLPDAGEFSLEERMGCGTGLCFGCTVATTEGPKRICHDGPVFKKNQLQW